MPGCHVIKGNDKPCGNYSLKNKTCCWVHKALEDTPYTEKDGKIKKSVVTESNQCVFICKTGKRCSRLWSYHDPNMCRQHKNISEFQKGLKPAPVGESEFFTSGKFHKIQLASKVRASVSESESESDDDDYSKDPSYKPSGRRAYNGRVYAAKTANGEPRCQFIFDDFVQCSSIDNNNRFCNFHHFHAK